MSYGIDENTQESNVSSSINAGIQENIKLESVDFASVSETGDPVIQVNFIDEFGSTLREILWEVDEEQTKQWNRSADKTHGRTNKEMGWEKGDPITDEDAVKKAYMLFNQRAKHIATKFVDEDTIVEALKGAGSYKEFGEAYAGLFTEDRISNTLVRLKVVLNSKDYSTLPKFPPFIESMSVPRDKSKLEIDPQYDRVTKANADTDADDPMSMAEEDGQMPDSPTF